VSTTVTGERRLRVSAISYLNTVPLMYGFRHAPTHEEWAQRFEVHYTLPSQCAEELRAGTSDIGIIPVAAYASIPGLRIIPDVAIAAKHPVRSILLVSKVPLRGVRSVAADTSSRTSVALMKVLFERRFGARPEYVPEPPDVKQMLSRHDAALLIGDPALRIDPATCGHTCYDLAAEWQGMTGCPFVFAFWAVRQYAVELAREYRASDAFLRSRELGTSHVDQIVREEARRYGVSAELARKYLSYHIDYTLDEANITGLQLFFRYAAECGALPSAPELAFI
jgi:chorismate dehydratase